MEQENANEDERYLKACENVKKIVNAIKKIKMKYYTNFSKISERDKEIYNELKDNLEKISQDNNLDNLTSVLMEEVSAKYEKKDFRTEKNNSNNPNSVDNRLLACYGNIDVQKEAISLGKIGKARKCQKILQEYLDEIDITNYKELVTYYKREKFAELVIERENIDKKNEYWNELAKSCFEAGTASEREQATASIEEARKVSLGLFKESSKENNHKVSELEPQIG